jgi:hypothetical protein
LRGPVGSLGAPEAPDEFEPAQGDGFVVFIHRDVLAAAALPGSIQFNFGRFGECSVVIEERDELRAWAGES